MLLTHAQKIDNANRWFDSPASGVLQAFAIGLSQSVTALEEAFCDLSDDQLRAFPIEGRNNIAWIVMHCIYSIDFFAVFRQRPEGALTVEWDRRWSWSCPRPTAEESFPSAEEMLQLLEARASERHCRTRGHARRGFGHLPQCADRREIRTLLQPHRPPSEHAYSTDLAVARFAGDHQRMA